MDKSESKRPYDPSDMDREIDDILLGICDRTDNLHPPEKPYETDVGESVRNANKSSKLSLVQEELKILWNEGYSTSYICNKLGISQLTLNSYRKKLGLSSRPKGNPLYFMRKDLVRLLIKRELYRNQGAVFLNELPRKISIASLDEIRRIIASSREFGACKLEIDLISPLRGTINHFFNWRTSDSIIFLRSDRRGLFLRLSEVLCNSTTKQPGGLSASRIKELLYMILKGHNYTIEEYELMIELVNSRFSQEWLKRMIDEKLRFEDEERIEQLELHLGRLTKLQNLSKGSRRKKTRSAALARLDLNHALMTRAYEIISNAGEGGISQSDLWKALSINSNEGARICRILEERNLVTREKVLHEGRWTYNLASKPIGTLEDIKEAIRGLLEMKKEKGITPITLSSSLKESFPLQRDEIRSAIREMLNEGTILKVGTTSKTLVLSKYYDRTDTQSAQYRKKIFGRRLPSPPDFLEEISFLKRGDLSSTENNRTSRIAGLFMVHNYDIAAPPSRLRSFYRFIAYQRAKSICVSIVDSEEITVARLLESYNALPHAHIGLLITFEDLLDSRILEIASSLNDRQQSDRKLFVWTKKHLLDFIAQANSEPSRVGSISKIMYGEGRGLYAKILSTDFAGKLQQVQVLGDSDTTKVFFGSVAEIPTNHKVSVHQGEYSRFIALLKSMTTSQEFQRGFQLLEPHLEQEELALFESSKPFVINALSDSYRLKVHMNVRWEGYTELDSYDDNDTPQDFCRKAVISCDCIAWHDQIGLTLNLCRHMVSVLAALWYKVNSISKLMMYAEELRFFCKDSPVLYEFIRDVVNSNSNSLIEATRLAFHAKSKGIEDSKDFESTLMQVVKGADNLPDPRGQSLLEDDTYFQIGEETIDRLYSVLRSHPEVNQAFSNLRPYYSRGLEITLNALTSQTSS